MTVHATPDVFQTLTEEHLIEHFADRHVGLDPQAVETMVSALGYADLDALIDDALPATIRSQQQLELPTALTERASLETLLRYSSQNSSTVSMLGEGYYNTVTPNVILRNVLESPSWYTAYTPYQAEVSQGRLEALTNFQQMIVDLTGLPLANASLLDEATAAAEAVAMAKRVSKAKTDVFFVDERCHRQTIAVLETRAVALGLEMRVCPLGAELISAEPCFAVVAQYPDTVGDVVPLEPIVDAAHQHGALAIVATDLLALVALRSPGECGADIAIGSAQRFGVPMGFGGPHAAFFATDDAHRRSVPGRIIGVSKDAEGRVAYRMALQTREQHIRREKATSNICTAQVLLAVISGLYAVFHGADGLRQIAARVHLRARQLAGALQANGFQLASERFFDTVTVLAEDAPAIWRRARDNGVSIRRLGGNRLVISCDERTEEADLRSVLGAFGASLDDASVHAGLPAAYFRRDEILTHPVFSQYRSETEMLRYLRRLAEKDIALDRAMIPLGSCTMKLNATAEMIPITWPGFASLHPFAPTEDFAGYRSLFEDLEAWLCACTGFHAVSLQPNAGSQGEFSGLLVIAAYHRARGESDRNICLIPASAHGTNPASAVMAGLKVVVVACDEDGNVDVDDLSEKAKAAGERLAALMITYPSTHGVFETRIRDICDVVHGYGGQVYMDGANLNALVGLSWPAALGADVAHMNLHKTFCIPHGGGGPGMGPIGVAPHLAPFLPNHPIHDPSARHRTDADPVGPVSAAPWGSSSILPISWAYIAMMGADGLVRATKAAILSANYIAHRLGPHYSVLYTGEQGLVAHECIIDLRWLKGATGLTVDDIAKRLADYGFHAPTMSFPVAETLMIEPTESESLTEIDRFCDAMIAIRSEIAAIESGASDRENNVLVNAPHTHRVLLEEPWTRPYSRTEACFPAGDEVGKYWPPVARIDNVGGDRNLICTCPPLEDYEEAAD
ncbi:MAG: aminomethyl-transferring glycine dehydrogenase [Pseudomonadota bacterium]